MRDIKEHIMRIERVALTGRGVVIIVGKLDSTPRREIEIQTGSDFGNIAVSMYGRLNLPGSPFSVTAMASNGNEERLVNFFSSVGEITLIEQL